MPHAIFTIDTRQAKIKEEAIYSKITMESEAANADIRSKAWLS